MANRWYVALNGEELGPMSDTGLERMIQGGRIEGETLVRNGTASDWLPAREAEEILAARPSRQRPGDAAIHAAIQSKRAAASLPPPPSPTTPPPPAQPPAEDLSDALPAPDDLPTTGRPPAAVAPAADSASSTPACDQSSAPEPLRSSSSRSPLVLVAVGAGSVLIFAASFAVAWMTVRQFSSGGAAATNGSAAPMASAQLAALEGEAQRLADEVAEAKQKLEQAQQADGSADQAPPLKPADLENPPKPVTLAEERDSLAKAIALDMARQEDAQERFNYEWTFEIQAPAGSRAPLPYQSQRDVRYALHLPVIEIELSPLDREALAGRRAAFEQATNARKQRTERLLAEALEAVRRLDIDRAAEILKEYMPLVDGDEYAKAINLFRQLGPARIDKLLKYVQSLTGPQRQTLAAKGPAPAELLERFDDPELIEAVQTHWPQVASLAIAQAREGDWLNLYDQAVGPIDLTLARKWQFLTRAFVSRHQRDLTPARAAELIETFGVFELEGEPSLGDGLLTQFPAGDWAKQPFAFFSAYAQGEVSQVASTDLFEECRKLAGEAWPSEGRLHPLAGHWADHAQWHIYIDPALDTITYARKKRPHVIQRICKIGPDYLVAYEKRLLPDHKSGDLVAGDPFYGWPKDRNDAEFDQFFQLPSYKKEFLGNKESRGPMLSYSVSGGGQYLALTLYALANGNQKSLRVLRKEIMDPNYPQAELFGDKSDAWEKMNQVADYVDVKVRFHYVDDQRKP
ncbi:MAG TPA: DUF4339 domain-containing protein [Pirellulales bacterium]|nr:DUF4339 domain-containing protein [Pirellulales bacterium]